MTESDRHQVKFFIKKFEAIPDERWCCYAFVDDVGASCALGHTMTSAINGRLIETEESEALRTLFGGMGNLTHINDEHDDRYQQPTPKARILAALHDLIKP